MPKQPPSFFAGFRLFPFWWKATAGYIGLLAGGNEIADWSDFVSTVRDTVKGGNGLVFLFYVIWILVALAAYLARLKVRYDLAMIRYERRIKPEKGTRQRR